MKLISFVVCCYNSAKYMSKCVDSLLAGGDDVEIIIIDDGSKDETGKIADDYKAKYPNIIQVIHQENSGHGGGVQNGLAIATGKYFKVVDSDDWVDADAYQEFLNVLRDDEDDVDLYITDYVYCVKDKDNEVISYQKNFKAYQKMSFSEMKPLSVSEYLTIHSCAHKTSLLKSLNLQIPKKTFYEDNYFIYTPLPHIKTVKYLPLPLYDYFIGRPDQSVQKKVALSRYKDYVKIADICFGIYSIFDYRKDRKFYRLLVHQLRIILIEALIHMRQVKTKEAKVDFKEFKRKLKATNKKQYHYFKYRDIATIGLFWPGILGRTYARLLYWISHLVVSFN